MANKMKAEELKPCPFCGSDAIGRVTYTDKMFEIECSKCCRAQTIMETKERAIASWNERAHNMVSVDDAVKAFENSILYSIECGIVPTIHESIEMFKEQLNSK